MQTYNKINFLRYLFTAIGILLIGITLGYHQITPTKVPNNYSYETITLQDVSDEMADFNMTMSHLYQMSKEPHPSGSKEIEDVRTYLKTQLNSIGCEYEVMETTGNRKDEIESQVSWYNNYIEAHPEKKEENDEYFSSLGYSNYEEYYRGENNLVDTDEVKIVNYLVKIDAPDTEKGVMFVCHYDSTKYGPGAADDLISVSSVLETIRENSSKDDLKNDLYFLFTDGEELDLFGAKAFVRDYPQMRYTLNLILNLEARGNSGSLLMFETSVKNKALIKELNKALDHIPMFSFSVAVYRRMPNDTDLTEFLKEGYTGANFSVLGGPEHYHQPTDNFTNLNRDSAYMYHKTVRDLAEYFGRSNLNVLKASEDAVYFPFLKGNTIILSNRSMFLFTIVIGLLALMWVTLQIVLQKVRLRDIILSFGFLLSALAGASFLALGGTFLYNRIWDTDTWANVAGELNTLFLFVCFLTILWSLIILWISARRIHNRQGLLISSILLFTLTNFGFTLFFNSLAYIFTIPLCFLLAISILLGMFQERSSGRKFLIAFLVLQGIVTAILVTPVIYLFYTAILNDAILPGMILTVIAVLPVPISILSIFDNRKAADK